MSRTRRWLRYGLTVALVASVLSVLQTASPAAAATLPSGFQEQVVFTGLTQPTNIEFAPDGRIFVAEKRGVIKVFDNLSDTTPTIFADLSAQVHNQWDRGLLGLALAPNFPTNPWVYVLYSYDAAPGHVAPQWNDVCANANDGTCVIQGRLSRLQANGNVMTGSEQVLITDWCQQFPSHSIGDLHFGTDGMLYVTGGDGASFDATDYGQLAGASNPCGDPPGGAMTPPTAEGGALRSQDSRSTADPTGLNGAVLRLDPNTGAAAAGNPNIGAADLNQRRIVANGLRNPYHFTIRPGTNEVWIGDVGWTTWEEINRVVNPTSGVTNFGWPCYEGNGTQPGYDSANLNLCESLYTGGGHTAPYFTYNHSAKIVSTESCTTGSSSITGDVFYPTSGGTYPAGYSGALFFTDYSRNCIWAMKPATAGGLPSTSNIEVFDAGAAQPTDLAIGPGNELYYTDIGGTVRRIRYFPSNQPPTAVISATPTTGASPLTVNFNGSGSTDPDPADVGHLTYAWDFTNDGSTDSTAANPSFTYTANGTYTARLTVADTLGATGTATIPIIVGNNVPTAVIDTPTVGTTWKAGDTITFSGHATDQQDGTLAASRLTWHLRMQHCSSPTNCHTHFLQDFNGVASGSFVAPDHEYPSYLELELVATDSSNLTNTVVRRLDPQTTTITLGSSTPGLQLVVGAAAGTTPFNVTLIKNSTTTISAPTPQTLGATSYAFSAWSDGGAQTHVITAPAAATTYTATYTPTALPCTDSFGYTCSDGVRTFIPADTTVLPLTGDDAFTQIATPFPVKLYGGSYSQAWVDTNGLVSFQALSQGSYGHSAIPSTGGEATANLAVYPFWEDFIVDGSASVRTAVTGTAPNRKFIVEWRNVVFYRDPTARVSFEVAFDENGVITFAYSGIDGTPEEQGSLATVGIENAAGTVALQYSYQQTVLRSGNGVTFTPPGAAPPTTGGVSGTVTSGGTAVSGATVTLGGVGTTTSAANGSYSFANVPVGSYTVTASTGSVCAALAGSTPVTVSSGTTATANIAVSGTTLQDSFGYTCSDGARTFTPANTTVLALTGDDAFTQIATPFPVKLYGGSYSQAWVDTNGLVSFQALSQGAYGVSAIPSTGGEARANLAVYPFWDDFIVDGSASVRTAVTGTAPNRKFIVEWRNVVFYRDPNARVTFEVVFDEAGPITFAYSGIDATVMEQGSLATVGIENAAGTVALQYSYQQTVLRSGNGVTFTPPGAAPPTTGGVSGTVTSGGTAVSGATVTLGGVGTTTSAANGSYSFANVPVGSYTVTASTGSVCAPLSGSTPVTVSSGATATANVAVSGTTLRDSFGYTCSDGARTFTPADTTVLPLTGDDAFVQIATPFPVKLYGGSYSQAWVDTNGLVSFQALAQGAYGVSALPSTGGEAAANLAVYPFWDDFIVDGSASVRTTVTGTAPNRKFIVEWRNVVFYRDPNARVSFEVIFDEAGPITFAYSGIDATVMEQGSLASIGIENAAGTVALQYAYQRTVLRSGNGVTFTPPA